MIKETIFTAAFLLLLTMGVTVPAEEPDYGDDPASAEPILTDGTILYGVITPTDDQDWFTFTTAGSTRYLVTFTNQDTNWKTVRVWQEDEFSEPQAAIYKSVYGNTITIDFFLDANYPCYLQVEGGTGDYGIKIELLGTSSPDGYPDTCVAAQTVVVDTVTAGTIFPDNEPDSDEDWFTFGTTELHMYRISLWCTENSWVYFRTWSEDCSTRLYSNSGEITVTSWYGEGYNLQVIGALDRLGNYYEIQVEDIGTYPDDHGNTWDVATGITNDGTEVFADINYNSTLNSDQDWFSFSCPGSGRFMVSMRNNVSNWKTMRLYLLDEFDLLREVINFSIYNNIGSRLVFLDEPGTYYIEVEGGAGEYGVSVELLDVVPPDSYSDDCVTADTIVVDAAPTVGTLAPDGDLDWLDFDTETLHKYEITLTHTDNSWVRFRLFDDTCANQIWGDSTTITLVSWYGDHYRLRVHGNDTRYGNYYNLRVEDLGLQPDDYGNTYDVATPISKDGIWVEGTTDYAATVGGDEDWFSFVAPIDGTYEIGFDNNVTGWKSLTLYRVNEFDEPVEIYRFNLYNNQETRQVELTAGLHYIRIKDAVGHYRVSVLSPEPRCGDLDHPYPAGDTNHDCYVDMRDVAVLAGTWLECSDPEPPCNYNP